MSLYEPHVCGVPLSAFAAAPTPAELGAIVAKWPIFDQVHFLMFLAGSMRNNSGHKREGRWRDIGRVLVAQEERLLDGEASQMLAAIAEGMKESAS